MLMELRAAPNISKRRTNIVVRWYEAGDQQVILPGVRPGTFDPEANQGWHIQRASAVAAGTQRFQSRWHSPTAASISFGRINVSRRTRPTYARSTFSARASSRIEA